MVKSQGEGCCCGCSLKLGVTLIGIFNLLIFLAGIILLVAYVENGIEALARYGFRSDADIIIMSIMSMFCLLIGICLIWGARKELSKLLVLGNVLFISINLIEIILFLTISVRYFIDGKPQKGAVELCKCIGAVSLAVYLSTIIDRLRLQIQRNAADNASPNA